MSCKHMKVEGNTTKYFYCGLKGKVINENTDCINCLLKIEDKNVQLKAMFEQIFGKGFGGI